MTHHVGELEFDTKIQALAIVRDILDRNLGNSIVGDDATLLEAIIAAHPNYGKKIGGRKYRLTSLENHTLLADFEDGTRDAISWLKCINGHDHRKEVLRAAREHIRAQKPTRAPRVGDPCEKCQVNFRPVDVFAKNATHWDHHPVPFEDIWSEWLAIEAITEDDIGAYDKVFHESQLAQRWEDYHRSRADWRLVHRRCNLSGAK